MARSGVLGPTEHRRSIIISWLLVGALNVVACGKAPVQVVDPPPIVDTQGVWSPTSDLIAYTHFAQTMSELANGPAQVWLNDIATRTSRFLVSGTDPCWAPDGTALVYVNNGQIYVYDIATASITRLASITGCLSPSWSPDRTTIAFETNYQDPSGANVIWTIQQDGSGLRDISQHGVGEWKQPRWSPDGRTILHTRYMAGVRGSEVFVMDTSGVNPTRLTMNSLDDRDPSWSRSGNWITWTSVGLKGEPSGIWTMDANGGHKVFVGLDGFSSSWSRDDQEIVFSRPDAAGKMVLWRAHPDGTRLAQITFP